MSTFFRTTLCKIGHFFVRLSVKEKLSRLNKPIQGYDFVKMAVFLLALVFTGLIISKAIALPIIDPGDVETTIFNSYVADDEDKEDENSLFNEGTPTEIEFREDGSVYIYLGNRINSASVNGEVMYTVTESPPGTPIVIVTDGFGGSVHHGVKLFNAINSSKADITYRIRGNVYSMHSMLACSNAKIEVPPIGYMMFHNWGASGLTGKAQEIMAMTKATDKVVNELFKSCIQKGLLTTFEVLTIKKGDDIYLDFNEVNKRLGN